MFEWLSITDSFLKMDELDVAKAEFAGTTSESNLFTQQNYGHQ
jgi:hypothetical protein